MSFPIVINEIDELQNYIANIKSNIIDIIYPIGSIYMSANNVSPATFLGGTWTQIKDKFLLCSGDTYSSGSTGGEATHTLTTAEMPAHTHTASTNSTGAHTHTMNVNIYGNPDGWGDYGRTYWNNQWGSSGPATASAGAHTHTVSIGSVGSGTAHNNMPPYLAVYCWERTA